MKCARCENEVDLPYGVFCSRCQEVGMFERALDEDKVPTGWDPAKGEVWSRSGRKIPVSPNSLYWAHLNTPRRKKRRPRP